MILENIGAAEEVAIAFIPGSSKSFSRKAAKLTFVELQSLNKARGILDIRKFA